MRSMLAGSGKMIYQSITWRDFKKLYSNQNHKKKKKASYQNLISKWVTS